MPVTGGGTLDLGANRPTLDGAGENNELPSTIVVTPTEGETDTITINVTPGTTLPEDFQVVVKDPVTGENKPIAGVTLDPETGTLTVTVGENTWTGNGDGTNWANPDNWSQGVVPGAGSDVVIEVGAGETVTIPDGTQLGDLTVKGEGSVTIGGGTDISGDLVIDGGTVTIPEGGTVTVGGDTVIKNDGTLNVDGTFTTDTITKPEIEEGSEDKATGTVNVGEGGSVTVGKGETQPGSGTVDLPDAGYDVTVDGGSIIVTGGTTDDTVVNVTGGSTVTGPTEGEGTVNVSGEGNVTVGGNVDLGETRPNVKPSGNANITVTPTEDELVSGVVVIPGDFTEETKPTVTVEGVPGTETAVDPETGDLNVSLDLPTLSEDADSWEGGNWTQGGQPMENASAEGVVVIDGTGSEGGITVTLPIPDGITDVVIKGDVTFTDDDADLPTLIVSEGGTVKLPDTIGTGDTVPVTGGGTLDLGANRPTLDGAGEGNALPPTIVVTATEEELKNGAVTLPVVPGTTLPDGAQIVIEDAEGNHVATVGGALAEDMLTAGFAVMNPLPGGGDVSDAVRDAIVEDAMGNGITGPFDVALTPNGKPAGNLDGATLEEALDIFEDLTPTVTEDAEGNKTLTYAFWFGIARFTLENGTWKVTAQAMDANAENKPAVLAAGCVYTLKTNLPEASTPKVTAVDEANRGQGLVVLSVENAPALSSAEGLACEIDLFIEAPQATPAE